LARFLDWLGTKAQVSLLWTLSMFGFGFLRF
jgi:hypothetical protein